MGKLIWVGLLLVLAGSAGAETVRKVGKVTWHAATYAGQDLALKGYVLASGDGYVLFSDEAGGEVSAHDLPVTGPGFDTMAKGRKYLLHGKFVKGVRFANGSMYHLELAVAPELMTAP